MCVLKPGIKYRIYLPDGKIFKSCAEFIGMIPPKTILTDEEINRYYGDDLDYRAYNIAKNSWASSRYIFDKCIISDKYIDLVEEEIN